MRHAARLLLALLVLGLAGVLLFQWGWGKDLLVHARWVPPPAVVPQVERVAGVPEPSADLNRYVATLDRPLFATTRRPPPPPAPSASTAIVVNSPPDLRVLGLYGRRAENAASGGMIAVVGGQVKRVRIGESVDQWTLKELRADEVLLVSGDAQQAYPLRRVSGSEPLPTAAEGASSGPAPAARPAAASAFMQRELEQARERVRRVNALRARNGMPLEPVP